MNSERKDSQIESSTDTAVGGEVLRVENLRKWYPLRKGFMETLLSKVEASVKAVDLVSFSLGKGEIFALAGESGSGGCPSRRFPLSLPSRAQWGAKAEGSRCQGVHS